MADETTPETTDPKTPKAPTTRDYGIYQNITIDLTTQEGLEAASKLTGSGTFTVLHELGTVNADDPKKALQTLGEGVDLAGDFLVAAKTSFKPFNDVTSETKRVVKV